MEDPAHVRDRGGRAGREVACRAMRAWPVLLVLVVAGCGGGTAAAPTVTAPEPSTTTAAATTTTAATAPLTTGQPPVTTSQRPQLTFPATTPPEVLALAGQRPTGVADYQVTITGGDATGTTPAPTRPAPTRRAAPRRAPTPPAPVRPGPTRRRPA